MLFGIFAEKLFDFFLDRHREFTGFCELLTEKKQEDAVFLGMLK